MKFALLVLAGVAVFGVVHHVTAPAPRLQFGDAGIAQFAPAAFSRDGKTILARGYRSGPVFGAPSQSLLRLWDTSSGKQIRDYKTNSEKQTQEIRKVGISPDGKYVFAIGQDFPLTMWETETGKEIRTFAATTISTGRIAFTPDGLNVISASGMLRIWETKSGDLLRDLDYRKTGPRGGAGDAQIFFSIDAKYIVLDCGTDVSVWDFEKLEMKFAFVQYPPTRPIEFRLPVVNAVRGFAMSPDGQGLWITTTDGKITEYEIDTGKLRKSYQINPDGDIHVLAVSPKGDKIMTTGFHGNTIVYSFPECKEIKRMLGYGHVQFSPDGKTALTFTKNGRMMLWDLDK